MNTINHKNGTLADVLKATSAFLIAVCASHVHNTHAEIFTESLVNAVEGNSYNQTKAALDAGANANSVNMYDEPVLLIAARKGYDQIVKLLLQFGAYVDMQDAYNMTPLMEAAKAGHLSVVKILLEAGANKDVVDLMDNNARYYADKNGHTHIANLL